MWNTTPHLPAPRSHIENRYDEKFEATGRSGHNTGVKSNAPGLQSDSDVWRSTYQLIDVNRPELGAHFENRKPAQQQSDPFSQLLSSFLNQISHALSTMLKGFTPEAVNSQRVVDKPKAETEKSHLGKLLATAKATITPLDQQIFSRLDGRPPSTPQEQSAVEKFAVIERELEKTLTKHPSEYTQQQVPLDTTDLETILTHEGFMTRRETEVMEKLYEQGGTLTLDEQLIALKLDIVGSLWPQG